MLRNILNNQPFSLRGLLVLLLSYVALNNYAIPEKDLIAYIIGGAGLGLLAYSLLILPIFRIKLAKKIKARSFFDSKTLYAKKENSAGLQIENVKLPPLFRLKIKRIFKHPGSNSSVHLLKQKSNNKRYLIDHISFPHRGLWELQALEFTLGDAFGFCRLSWRYKLQQEVEVLPQKVEIAALPHLVSSAQAGEQMNLDQKRSGDLYDLKAYDPSDGTKRILWKRYAKSGELVVRIPEPAVIPEGELALYLVAEKEDDEIAAALLNYREQLERKDIITLFSCDGLAGKYEKEAPEIQHAVLQNVWHKNDASQLLDFIKNLSTTKRNLREIVCFCSNKKEILDNIAKAKSSTNVKINVAAFENYPQLDSIKIEKL